jgi:hypothetical protein
MSRQRPNPLRSAVLPALVAVLVMAFSHAEAAPARCTTFEVAELPFSACVDVAAPGGGFVLYGPGYSNGLGGLLVDGEEEPFFLLNTDYAPDTPIGLHAPPPSYFSLTLRWDSAGTRRGILAMEVCGPRPLVVRLEMRGPGDLRHCGQWMTLMADLEFPGTLPRKFG